ncbi:MAG: DUF4065 domain-containing protein [Prevotellaceae bacterium]|jgi:uncharacterized phage-associated protein|nr:DUF4065 domain-containing protein [Prevotellaceae bacterium]
MKTDAIAVANYFVDLAEEEKCELKQFGLMKRVYITHGLCLAILNKSALNPRFDVVEAWKNGPVIPSVYHSFKHNKNLPIKEKSVIAEWTGMETKYHTPELAHDCDDIKEIAAAVFEKYRGFTDAEMIALLHRDGTPWALCYEEGKNNKIPDLYTKVFYKKVLGL